MISTFSTQFVVGIEEFLYVLRVATAFGMIDIVDIVIVGL